MGKEYWSILSSLREIVLIEFNFLLQNGLSHD